MSYKCSYCKGDFKDPRLLGCFHTFCRFCLDEYLMENYDDGKFPCPICKEYHSVPVNGARGLPKNSFVKLQDDVIVYCSICDKRGKADSACRNCHVNLCKSCLLKHISTSGDHSIKRLVNNGGKNEGTCQDHLNQVLELFCETCEKSMCVSCNLSYHRSHDVRDIGSKANLLKMQLETEVQALKTKSLTKNLEDKLMNRRSELQMYHDDRLTTIEERARDLHKIVDEIRTEQISKIMTEHLEEKDKYNEDENEIKTEIASVEEILKFCNNFLKYANDIDVVSHFSKLIKQINTSAQKDCQINGIRKKQFHSLDAQITRLEVQKIFGNFEISNRRPTHIKSISRLSNLRRTNSEGDANKPEESTRQGSSYTRGKQGSSSNKAWKRIFNSVSRKKRFTCSDGIVTGLSITPDGAICVCIGNEGILEIHDPTGRLYERYKFGISIDDVVSNNTGILYVSSNFNKKIFKVENSQKELFAETRSCVRGLGIDNYGNLIIGMTAKGSFFDKQKEGYVTKISRENKMTRLIEDSKLSYPARIAVSSERRQIISDWIQGYVILCWDDTIMDIYTGSGSSSKEFIPRGVCTLSNGDIIVVDISSNKLHWVSSEGKLRNLVKVDDCGDLWSVTADKDDTVWVGTQDGQVIPVKIL